MWHFRTSSVHALFGSKEQLQLATISAARDSFITFITEVVGPAFSSTEPGRERLLALCEGYLSYVDRPGWAGRAKRAIVSPTATR